MESVNLYRQGQFLGRFPSSHNAARWIMCHDRVDASLAAGEWASRVMRAWAAMGDRSVEVCRTATWSAPPAIGEEAEHIRMVGWSG